MDKKLVQGLAKLGSVFLKKHRQDLANECFRLISNLTNEAPEDNIRREYNDLVDKLYEVCNKNK